MADPGTKNSCTIEPYKSVRTDIGSGTPMNYAAVRIGLVNDEEFNTQLNDLLGGSNFGIAYYVFSTRFFPGAKVDSDGVIPAVWITCKGVVWCDPNTSKAVLGTNVETKNADGVASSGGNQQNFFEYSLNEPWVTSGVGDGCATEWFDAPCWSTITKPMRFGGASSSCDTMHYQPSYSPRGIPTDARNFLWQTVCHQDVGGGKSGVRTVQGASIMANLGQLPGSPRAQDVLSPLDVMTLNYPAEQGGVSSVATTLGTYPITAPMIKTLGGTTVDYTQPHPLGAMTGGTKAVVWDNEKGNFTVEFYRPQRSQFPGEEGGTGLHDLHGLNYGLEIEVGSVQFGCGQGSATGSGGLPDVTSAYVANAAVWSVNAGNDSYANFLAPLRDNKVVDSPSEVPGTSTLSLSVDLIQCILDRKDWLMGQGIDVASMNLPEGSPVDGSATNWKSTTGLSSNGEGNCIHVNLNARGEAKTGGTDSAAQGFCLQFAPGTFSGQQ